jgi:hypothetical protein
VLVVDLNTYYYRLSQILATDFANNIENQVLQVPRTEIERLTTEILVQPPSDPLSTVTTTIAAAAATELTGSQFSDPSQCDHLVSHSPKPNPSARAQSKSFGLDISIIGKRLSGRLKAEAIDAESFTTHIPDSFE